MKEIIEDTFIKITGDLVPKPDETFRPDVIKRIRLIERDYFITLLPGGGSEISAELDRRGIAYEFGPLGREIKGNEGRQAARDILEDHQARVQNLLKGEGIQAEVIPSFRNMGSKLCHVNGDLMVMEAYVNYPKLFIFTLKGERLKKKKRAFRGYPKVEVIGFPKKYKG